jgi:DNA-binding transcriptional LysR family regulator
VTAGAFLTACNSFVPAALARFEAAHPDVKVELEQLEPPAALRRLRAGELDIAVTWEPFAQSGARERQPEDGFEHMYLADDPYRMVLPVAHRLARRRELRMEGLADERFIGPPPETSPGYHTLLEDLCHDAGFEPDIEYVVRDVTVGRAFVAAGVCVAPMPELAIQQPRPDVAVRPVRGLDPVRSLYATWLRGRRMPGIPAMAKELAAAAEVRLGSAAGAGP